MSSVGAGGGGGGILNDGISAADAPDPNAPTARLSAAPTQAGTNFLNSMTLPLSPLLLDPLSPVPCARKRSPHLARHVPSAIIRAGADNVGDGSTQSSPDCTFMSSKGCPISRGCTAAVANLAYGSQPPRSAIGLAARDNLS